LRAKSALSSQAPAARSAGDCHSAALAAVRPATLLGPSPLASSNATATRRTRHGNAISAARLLAGARGSWRVADHANDCRLIDHDQVWHW